MKIKIETVEEWMARTNQEPRKVDFSQAYKKKYRYYAPLKKNKQFLAKQKELKNKQETDKTNP